MQSWVPELICIPSHVPFTPDSEIAQHTHCDPLQVTPAGEGVGSAKVAPRQVSVLFA
jgi:hypothetical protein